MNDLSQLISEPTRIPDGSGDKANTLDLFLTSNPDMYSNPILDSPLGNSDHCLITLQHNFVSHQDRSSSSHKVFHSLRNLIAAYPWHSGYSNDPSSSATFITNTIQIVLDLLFHLPISQAESLLQSGSMHNMQKLSNIKTTTLNNGNFTKLRIQELYLYKLSQPMLQNHQSCQNLLRQPHQQ